MDDYNPHSFLCLELNRENYGDLSQYIKRLPETEQRILKSFYLDNFKQIEIAEMYGITQGAVSHRLSRARRRILFMQELDKLCGDTKEMFKSIAVDTNVFEFELIRIMVETTCQSETADRLNVLFNLYGERVMNQIKVKHKFFMLLKRLEKKPYYKVLKFISDNLYVMHEVRLPHYDRT